MAYRRNKRRYGRRRHESRGGSVVPVIACIILAPLAVIFALTVFFKVATVTVSGESGYPDSRIVEASGIKVGDNMFRFNKFEAIEGIFAEMPYIDELSIRRKLPGTVEITVSRCEPALTVQSENRWYLADIKGKLLEVSDTPHENVIKVTGAELFEPEIGKYMKIFEEEKQNPLFLLLNTLKNNGIIPYISDINMQKIYAIKFLYKDRLTVNIGTTEGIEKKLRFMLLIAEERLAPTDEGTIDVSDAVTARFIPNRK